MNHEIKSYDSLGTEKEQYNEECIYFGSLRNFHIPSMCVTPWLVL